MGPFSIAMLVYRSVRAYLLVVGSPTHVEKYANVKMGWFIFPNFRDGTSKNMNEITT